MTVSNNLASVDNLGCYFILFYYLHVITRSKTNERHHQNRNSTTYRRLEEHSRVGLL